MKILLSLFLSLLIFSDGASASANEPTQTEAPLEVIATFSILGDLVRNVAGDTVKLRILVGVDSDGHLYQPNADDARALASTDLLVANGLGFETWLTPLINAAEFNGALLVVGKSVKPLMVEDHHNPEFKVPDPHAWQDINNVVIYVRLIADKLSELDKTHSHFYQQNARNYIARLELLDQELKKFSASLPDDNKKIVTSHDAFGYFGQAYGLIFIAPQGISTDAEARTKDVAALIRQIRREKITALFVENMLDDRLLQQVSRETGARIGGRLYSDALSAPGKAAPDYLSMMKHNLVTLQSTLSGSAQ